MDYEHIPFKCRASQEHGHFQRNCPKIQTPEKEEAEGWQKVKKSKAAPKPKDPRAVQAKDQPLVNPRHLKEPLKEGASSSKESTKETTEIASQPTSPSKAPAKEKSDHPAKEPQKLDDEHITIGSDPGAESDEGATETSSSVGTPEKNPRGRKPERKKREEKSYRDVTAGVQQTIPDMIETKSSKKGRAPKGATPPPSDLKAIHLLELQRYGKQG